MAWFRIEYEPKQGCLYPAWSGKFGPFWSNQDFMCDDSIVAVIFYELFFKLNLTCKKTEFSILTSNGQTSQKTIRDHYHTAITNYILGFFLSITATFVPVSASNELIRSICSRKLRPSSLPKDISGTFRQRQYNNLHQNVCDMCHKPLRVSEIQ